MKLSLFYSLDTWVVSLIQFTIMLITILIGRWMARNHAGDTAENPGNSTISASLIGLFGLLVAFTFGMAGQRFNERRQIFVEEANAIGTATLRLQMYPDSVQPQFRDGFRNYVESRIHYFEAITVTEIQKSADEANRIGDQLWSLAARQSKIPSNLVASNQMIPALNEMLDIANTRKWVEFNRTPSSILIMLFLLSVASSFVAGYTSVGKGKFDWIMALSFCALTAMVVFFIIDLDNPRRGIITLHDQQQAIVDLRKMF